MPLFVPIVISALTAAASGFVAGGSAAYLRKTR